jgi:hypothetical protein
MVDEGFDTLETLADLEESDVDNMIKNVRETQRALGTLHSPSYLLRISGL